MASRIGVVDALRGAERALYRAAQDRAGSYGRRVVINRVDARARSYVGRLFGHGEPAAR